jgi:DNA-binding response OmpR family regulator
MAGILLVENGSLLGRLMALYLIDRGYQIARVSNADEVAPRLDGERPEIVIFNTGLPPAEKSTYIHEWKSSSPALKVLEISEQLFITSAESVDLSRLGRPDSVLPLPFDFARLPEVIESLLSGDGGQST